MRFEVGGVEPSLSGVEPSRRCREMLKSGRKTPGKLVDVTDFERYRELRWLWTMVETRKGGLGRVDFL